MQDTSKKQETEVFYCIAKLEVWKYISISKSHSISGKKTKKKLEFSDHEVKGRISKINNLLRAFIIPPSNSKIRININDCFQQMKINGNYYYHHREIVISIGGSFN